MTYRPGGDSFVARVRERDERVFRDGWPAGLLPSGRNCYNDRDRTVPRDCPANLGPWGAWRSFADPHMAMVFLSYWCAHVNGWAWDAYQIDKIVREAVPQLADAVGWSP